MQRPLCSLTVVLCASCYAEIGGPVPTQGQAPELPRRTFYEACDGSGVALDADRFLAFSDDEPTGRVYTRAGEGRPVSQIASSVGIEDAARVGQRIYAIGSHARDAATGEVDPARARFAAFVVDTFAAAGTSTTLLTDLLDPTTWLAPDTRVIDIVRASPAVSIEGLAFSPTTRYPTRMWIGFEAPLVDGRAIAVSLLDPAQAVSGVRAQLGEAAVLDLGGLGIRGMAWSDALGAVLVVAGPVEDERYRLYRWSGDAWDAPVAIIDLTAPLGAVAETIIAYPQSTDVQVVFDMSDAMVAADAPCRQVATSERSFQDVVVRVGD